MMWWRRAASRGVDQPPRGDEILAIDRDIRAFIEERRAGQYGDADRGRDFRAVFAGTSTPAQGRRVLTQILHWSGVFSPGWVSGDPYALHVREGGRELGYRIMAVVGRWPSDRSDTARSDDPKKERDGYDPTT